ncbi:MAG: hypothetical protein ABI182_04030 [Candidatus Baltobacteraceae bacterium]
MSAAATAALLAYLAALSHQDYSRAYAALQSAGQRYYRNETNFASAFRVDRFALERYRIVARRDGSGGQVFVVRETIRFYDDALDRFVRATVQVPYGVLGQSGTPKIKDPGHPWKAVGLSLSTSRNGVRATLRKIAFYPRYLAITITFINERSGFTTALPYDKSVLTDQTGAIYRSIVTTDWAMTDKAFFLGVHLAGDAEMTGTMRFAVPAGADPQTLTLELAPVVRDGESIAPFALDFAPIFTPAASS